MGLSNGAYNGGGISINSGASGGGATDIRLTNGVWNLFDGLKLRIMVAGGGGGACLRGEGYGDGNGGYGGSLAGGTGQSINHTQAYGYCTLTGGNQISGGITTWIDLGSGRYTTGSIIIANNGQFGYCASEHDGDNTVTTQGGGGSGYYGGAGGGHSGGGGGSSFISGYPGCNTIKETSTESNIQHSGSPNHYSGYVFTNSAMIAGNAVMPSPSGGTETGHTGNGYCIISYIP